MKYRGAFEGKLHSRFEQRSMPGCQGRRTSLSLSIPELAQLGGVMANYRQGMLALIAGYQQLGLTGRTKACLREFFAAADNVVNVADEQLEDVSSLFSLVMASKVMVLEGTQDSVSEYLALSQTHDVPSYPMLLGGGLSALSGGYRAGPSATGPDRFGS